MGGTWLGCLHSGKVCGHRLDRQTEQQETGRTYYPMKLLERDSSEEKTKKEQSQ